MTIKRCTKCNEEKLLRDFRKDSRRSDHRQSWCKSCMRTHQQTVYTKQYGAKARKRNSIRNKEMRERFMEYKATLQCSFCPENVSICLDFHHLDPKKKDFQLSSFGTRSWELIKAEIDKCVVACKNCHTKIHAGLIKV